jgi:HSP20 family molecular chaperone IbpA
MIDWRYGTFRRTFNIPDVVDINKVDAKLEAGVLQIVLPKLKRSSTRKIPITEK